MREAYAASFVLHAVALLLMWVNFPDFFKQPEPKVMNVRLVAAPNPKQQQAKEQPKKIRTQQSAAPREAPKPVPKPQPPKKADTPETKMVSAPQAEKVAVKKPEAKPKPQPEPEQQAQKPVSRPEKLDKTKRKQNIAESPDKDAEIVENPDDFLQALDFIKDLKTEQKAAQVVGEETEPTTITQADAQDIALIKRHIERNWYRPPGVKGLDELTVQVEVVLNRDGSISQLTMLKSSGQSFFDNSLLRAVRKSVPLPIPADKYETFKILDLRFNG